jgi:GNAT superfamily N-acetyltransferase
VAKKYEKEAEKVIDWKEMIKSCEAYYPGVDLWLKKKVIPDLKSGDRELLLSPNKEGFVIIKHSSIVSKICHMQFLPQYRNLGFGKELLHIALTRLASPLTVATIPEELMKSVMPVFSFFGFKEQTALYLYRKGMLEHVVLRVNFLNKTSHDSKKGEMKRENQTCDNDNNFTSEKMGKKE